MYFIYQKRGDGKPVLVCTYSTQEQAIDAGNELLAQWHEVGALPPTLFICYNGSESVEVWRDGKGVAK